MFAIGEVYMKLSDDKICPLSFSSEVMFCYKEKCGFWIAKEMCHADGSAYDDGECSIVKIGRSLEFMELDIRNGR